MGIGFLRSEVRYHVDMGNSFVGGYVESMDDKQCVGSFDVFPTLHESSEFSAGCFASGGPSWPSTRLARRLQIRASVPVVGFMTVFAKW